MVYSSVDDLLTHLNAAPQQIEFSDVIALIDTAFTFTPTAFINGQINNQVNQNNGSCKILALGQFLTLSQAQTLALFGRFYRDDVINNPDGNDHGNIRNFMRSGYNGVVFDSFPLIVNN